MAGLTARPRSRSLHLGAWLTEAPVPTRALSQGHRSALILLKWGGKK